MMKKFVYNSLLACVVLAGCNGNQPAVGNPVQNHLEKFNQDIAAGVATYAKKQGVEALFFMIPKTEVAQILDVSADKSAVLLQTAEHVKDGQVVFGRDVVYVNLETKSIVKTSAIETGRFRLGRFQPNSNSVGAVAKYSGEMVVVDFTTQQLIAKSKASLELYPSEIKWNSGGDSFGALMVGMESNVLARYEMQAGHILSVQNSKVGAIDGFRWQGNKMVQDMQVTPQSFNGYPRLGEFIPLKLPYATGSAVMTNGYAGHFPYNGNGNNIHPALDFADGAADRSQPVLASSGGTVIFVQDGNGVSGGPGTPSNMVYLEHPGPNNARYSSGYLHIEKGSSPVRVGDVVAMGQKVGTVGDIGYTVPVNAAHIHFQVNTTTNVYGVGGQALAEPMDGYETFSNQNSYVSTNGNGNPQPTCTPSNSAPGDLAVMAWDDTPGEFQKLGISPQYWYSENTSDGGKGSSTFTYSVNGSDENYGEWSLKAPKHGKYDLYVFTPTPTENKTPLPGYGNNNPAVGVKYKVLNAAGSEIAVSAPITQSRGCWHKAATNLTLNADETYKVRLGDAVTGSADSKIYFDTVGFKLTQEITQPVPNCPASDPGNMHVAAWDDTASEFSTTGNYWYREVTNGGYSSSAFTYTVNGGDQSVGTWNLKPTVSGIFDVYVFTPNPMEDTKPLGAFGNQNVATGVEYKLRNGSGAEIGTSGKINQDRGCWHKIVANITLNRNEAYTVRLGDSVTGAANSKLYFDSVGFKLIQEITKPNWVVSPTSLSFTGVVGSTPNNQSISINNTGNGLGTFALTSSNSALVSAQGYNSTLAAGASTTATVSVAACTAVGTSNATLSIANADSNASVNITRVCTAAPTPSWQVTPTGLAFSDVVGGGAPLSKSFALSNTGATGAYSISSNQAWLSALPASGTVNANQAATINVSVSDCVTASNDAGVLTISGGGQSASVAVSRTCQAALPNPPGAASIASITMSSNGRILLVWPEMVSANHYEFQATFDGAPISVTGQAPNRGGTNGSAVATFMSAPEALDKQSKQVCFSIRATNAGGAGAYSGFVCTTYKFYAGGLTPQSINDDSIRLGLR